METIYIGLDIGTTAIKISAVNGQMQPQFEEQYQYDYLIPQKEWTEIDPQSWVQITLSGLTRLFQNIPANLVKGIGITGQMHTTVFVDKDGSSVRPAILWNDHRTKNSISQIKNRLKKHAATVHISKIVSTGSPLANLIWLKEHEPFNYKKVSKIMMAKDYVRMKLTDVIATDFCDASTSSFYDLYKECWSEEVMQEFSIDKSLLPEIHAASERIGELTEEIQQKLGISQGIPVVTGTGDNIASAVAAGCFTDQQPLLSLGTSGVVVIPNNQGRLKRIGKNVAAKINTADQNIITQGTVQAGAKTNSWWMESILRTEDFEREQEAIIQAGITMSDVLFCPHLNGEKTLFNLPNLQGSFFGLTLETSREEMYLAVLEGLAFGMKQIYEEIQNEDKPHYFTVVGGGAKSTLWLQLFATIFNCPIRRLSQAQEAVHGAAVLAMGITGAEISVDSQPFELILPQPKLVKWYEEKYIQYQLMVKTLIHFAKAVNT